MLYAEESNPVTVAANLMLMDADVDHMLTEARVEALSAAEGDFLTISENQKHWSLNKKMTLWYLSGMTNGSSHWILRQPDQVSITDTMARGTRGPIWDPKDGRATDSCFAVIGAHQCGVLMVEPDDWLLLNPPQVKHLWFQ